MTKCSHCGEENAAKARFCWNCGNSMTPDAAPVEVRKTVTVMFMDAIGSTDAGERTDPESIRRVMTRYFDEIRSIVERHGGTVEKYIGDAVMAVFGVPAVHEDDALRAVRAATETRTRLADVSKELQAQRGTTVAWRTGINTGEVVAGDAGAGQRFVTGDAVNVAARLEQAAQAEEILLGPETYRIVRDSVVAEPVDPVAAKGKAEPVAAYRLIDLSRSAVAPVRRVDSPMIGRLRQRRLLAEAFDQAVDERACYLFTILGAAGVGKSRLVSEFLASVDGPAQVLHGRCLSYGEGITFWPIAEAIREAVGLTDDDDDDSLREKIGALIDDERDRRAVVERIGTLLGRFSASGVAEETYWAVRTLLEALARRRPLVVVLDDMHWAEPTLLDLVEHLADWMRDAPLLLLCVARQDLLEARPEWAGGKKYATTLTLEPLNESESKELMTNLLGEVELGGGLEQKIAAAAEGNPLFVEEMVGMLIDNGVLKRRNGGWAAAADLSDVAVPPTIQALLAARLDRLPIAERTVIERGAVEGKVFHRSAVAELSPEDLRQSVPDYLRALSRKELVRPDRSDFAGDEAFRFRHLLIRDAAYAAMPKEARADLHARFAAWLMRVAADHLAEYEEIIGYHLEQAYRYRSALGPLDDDGHKIGAEAARHLAASGQRAMRRGDVRAATKLFESAVELAPIEDPSRYRYIAHLGSVLSVTGELRRADNLLAEALEQARAADDALSIASLEVVRLGTLGTMSQLNVEVVVRRSTELLAVFEEHDDEWGIDRATFELGRHHFFAGRARVAEEILTRRIEDSARTETPLSMMFGFLYATTFWGPTPVGAAIARAQAWDASSSKALEATRLRVLGGLNGLIGDFHTGRQMLARSIEIELEIGRSAMASSAGGHFLGPLEHLAGDYVDAERIMRTSYDETSATGDLAFSSTVAGNLAALYVDMGRFEDAERYGRICVDTSTSDDVSAQSTGRSVVARVLAQRGQHAEAETLAREAWTVAEGTDYLTLRGDASAHLAEVLLAAGRRQEAVGAFERAIENFEAKGATVSTARARARLAEIQAGEG